MRRSSQGWNDRDRNRWYDDDGYDDDGYCDDDYDGDGNGRSCRYGLNCLRYDCVFSHPLGRPNTCDNPSFCKNFSCQLIKSEKRPKPCRFGASCNAVACTFVHPIERNLAKAPQKMVTVTSLSAGRGSGSAPSASLVRSSKGPCLSGATCTNLICAFEHPAERPGLCGSPTACDIFGCQLLHAKERIRDCRSGGGCSNLARCQFRHPNLAHSLGLAEGVPSSTTNVTPKASAKAFVGYPQPSPSPPGQSAHHQCCDLRAVVTSVGSQGVIVEEWGLSEPENTRSRFLPMALFNSWPLLPAASDVLSYRSHDAGVRVHGCRLWKCTRVLGDVDLQKLGQLFGGSAKSSGVDGPGLASQFLIVGGYLERFLSIVVETEIENKTTTNLEGATKTRVVVPDLLHALSLLIEALKSTKHQARSRGMSSGFEQLMQGGVFFSSLSKLIRTAGNADVTRVFGATFANKSIVHFFEKHFPLIREFLSLAVTLFPWAISTSALPVLDALRAVRPNILGACLLDSNCAEFRELFSSDLDSLLWTALEQVAMAAAVRSGIESVDQEATTWTGAAGCPTVRRLRCRLSASFAGTANSSLSWHLLPLVPDLGNLMSVPKISSGSTSGASMFEDRLLPEMRLSYGSLDDYLDTNFRLLRANCLLNLTRGVASLRGGKRDNCDVGVYSVIETQACHLLKNASSHGGFAVSMKCCLYSDADESPNNSKPKGVRYDAHPRPRKLAARHLMIGSLVGLSTTPKFVDLVLWGQVIERSVEHMQFATVTVSFLWRQRGGQVVSSSDVFHACLSGEMRFLVESPVYYQAYAPVMEVLQGRATLALENGKQANVSSLLSCLVGRENDVEAAKQELPWSAGALKHFDRKLSKLRPHDESQVEAIRLALRSRVCCIQGPPGSGKSYTGVTLVKCILQGMTHLEMGTKNMSDSLDDVESDGEVFTGVDDREDLPLELDRQILIVAQKNHSLDEFLADCQSLGLSVARIGSRGADPRLEDHALANLARRTPKSSELSRQQSELLNEKLGVVRRLEERMTDVREVDSPAYLTLKYASDEQLLSLTTWTVEVATLWLQVHNRTFALNDPALTGVQTLLASGLRSQICIADIEIFVTAWVGTLFQSRYSGSSAPNNFAFIDDDDDADENLERLMFTSVEKSFTLKVLYSWPGVSRLSESSPLLPDAYVPNLWSLQQDQRLSLLQLWRQWELQSNAALHSSDQELQALFREYDELSERLSALERVHQLRVLKPKQVIGCTLTGASIYSGLIAQLGCGVVLVEEAGENLEPQMLAAIPGGAQQLIQIGDPKQLRPLVEDFSLKAYHKLDVSMMERLMARGGYPAAQLRVQSRMPEDLAQLWQLVGRDGISALGASKVYENTVSTNSALVRKYDSKILKSMFSTDRPNLFWVRTDTVLDPEGRQDRSHTNDHEASKVALFAQFLAREGVPQESVVVLATYLGQVKLLRVLLRERGLTDIRCHAVDKFQGDEGDYLLLSLVRSNSEKKVGFLGTSSRAIVALSRQRCGLYIFGNDRLICEACPQVWEDVVQEVRSRGKLVDHLPLRCPRHHDNRLKLGECCRFPCAQQMNCGHTCLATCHPSGAHPACRFEVHDKFSACGHRVSRACSTPLSALKCSTLVDFQYRECGHHSKRKCHDRYLSSVQLPCRDQRTVKCHLCGHNGTMLCHLYQEDPLSYQCYAPCSRNMSCGHPCKLQCCQQCDSGMVDCEICAAERFVRTKELREQAKRDIADILAEKETLQDKGAGINSVRLIPLVEGSPEFREIEKELRSFMPGEGDTNRPQNYMSCGYSGQGGGGNPMKIKLLSASRIKNVLLQRRFLEAHEGALECSERTTRLVSCGNNESLARMVAQEGVRCRLQDGFVETIMEFGGPASDLGDSGLEKLVMVLCECQPGRVLSAIEKVMKSSELDSNSHASCESADSYVERQTGVHWVRNPDLLNPKAIVTVRLESTSSSRLDNPPKYWSGQILMIPQQLNGLADYFLVEETDRGAIDFLQHALRETSHRECAGVDGQGGTCKAEILKVWRNENPILWRQYAARREYLRQKNDVAYGGTKRLQPEVPAVLLKGMGNSANSMCAGALDLELHLDINERVLWHGTSLKIGHNVICRHGFDERVANLRGLYGAGSYFAEQACKSAQYAPCEDGNVSLLGAGKTKGRVRCMLLCRVTLGEPYYTESTMVELRRPPVRTGSSLKNTNKTGDESGDPFDSVVANSGVANGGKQSHRELIVYNGGQAYPQWMILF